MRILVCDTETTGLGPTRKAVEVAVIEIDQDLNILNKWESLIDPERPIDPGAEAVHGISYDMVKDAPTMEEFVEVVMGGPIQEEICIAGHNCQFDIPMLYPLGNLTYSVCTLELARKFIAGAPNYKLGTLQEFLSIPIAGQAHRAMADALVSYELLKIALPLSGRSLEQHAKTEDEVVHTMLFGKHAGKPLHSLPLAYINWLLALPDLDKKLRASLETIKVMK